MPRTLSHSSRLDPWLVLVKSAMRLVRSACVTASIVHCTLQLLGADTVQEIVLWEHIVPETSSGRAQYPAPTRKNYAKALFGRRVFAEIVEYYPGPFPNLKFSPEAHLYIFMC
jgi:hypothetical protein